MTISYVTRCGRCGAHGMIHVGAGADPFTIWRDRGWAVHVPQAGMVCPDCTTGPDLLVSGSMAGRIGAVRARLADEHTPPGAV